MWVSCGLEIFKASPAKLAFFLCNIFTRAVVYLFLSLSLMIQDYLKDIFSFLAYDI